MNNDLPDYDIYDFKMLWSNAYIIYLSYLYCYHL